MVSVKNPGKRKDVQRLAEDFYNPSVIVIPSLPNRKGVTILDGKTGRAYALKAKSNKEAIEKLSKLIEKRDKAEDKAKRKGLNVETPPNRTTGKPVVQEVLRSANALARQVFDTYLTLSRIDRPELLTAAGHLGRFLKRADLMVEESRTWFTETEDNKDELIP